MRVFIIFSIILLAEAICSKNSEKNMGNLCEFLLPKQNGFRPVYLYLIFAILQLEISSLINLIFSLFQS